MINNSLITARIRDVGSDGSRLPLTRTTWDGCTVRRVIIASLVITDRLSCLNRTKWALIGALEVGSDALPRAVVATKGRRRVVRLSSTVLFVSMAERFALQPRTDSSRSRQVDGIFLETCAFTLYPARSTAGRSHVVSITTYLSACDRD